MGFVEVVKISICFRIGFIGTLVVPCAASKELIAVIEICTILSVLFLRN